MARLLADFDTAHGGAVQDAQLDSYQAPATASTAGQNRCADEAKAKAHSGAAWLGSRTEYAGCAVGTGRFCVPLTAKTAITCQEAAPKFAEDERVVYLSQTHKMWMQARVLRVKKQDDGRFTYDLDVKKDAEEYNMRHDHEWVPTPVVNESRAAANRAALTKAIPHDTASHLHPCALDESDNMALVAADVAPSFHDSEQELEVEVCEPNVGDKVDYWSEHWNQWRSAVVLRVGSNGIYDLDIKKHAKGTRMRWPMPLGQPAQPLPPGSAPSQAALSSATHSQESEGRGLMPDSHAQQQQHQQDQVQHVRYLRRLQQKQLQKVHPAQPVQQMPQQQHTDCHSAADPGMPPAASRAALPPIQLNSTLVGQESPAASPVSSSGHSSVPPPVPFGASQRLLHQGAPARNIFMGTGLEISRQAAVPRVAPPAMALVGAQRAHQSQAALPGPLEVGDLHLRHVESFNPQEPSLAAQLRQGLSLNEQVNIEAMTGFKGGMNQGVWFVTDQVTGEELVLKLVRCQRPASNIPSEAENLQLLASEHPQLATDPAVAFPLKVFNCLGPDSTKRWDLIAMRKVQGERLSEWFAMAVHSNKRDLMLRLMQKLGATLAAFHARYNNVQHGDFQPANVLLDEKKEEFFLIDIGGMGIATMETDLEHFAKSMDLMALSYCPQLMADCVARFHRGYSSASQRRR